VIDRIIVIHLKGLGFIFLIVRDSHAFDLTATMRSRIDRMASTNSASLIRSRQDFSILRAFPKVFWS